jgi:hypothetical protein
LGQWTPERRCRPSKTSRSQDWLLLAGLETGQEKMP